MTLSSLVMVCGVFSLTCTCWRVIAVQQDGGRRGRVTNHADRVDSVPFVCDGVALAKEHVAEMRATVSTHGLKGRALGAAVHVTVVS